MMKFNVLKHIADTAEDKWLDDVEVNSLAELKEVVKRLQEEHKVEIEVNFMDEIIYVGYQGWANF